MQLEIKAEHKDEVIYFNNSGIPLGKRSQKDMLDLAIMARTSPHKRLSDVFVRLPSLAELQREKLSAVEQLTPATTQKITIPNEEVHPEAGNDKQGKASGQGS